MKLGNPPTKGCRARRAHKTRNVTTRRIKPRQAALLRQLPVQVQCSPPRLP